MTGRRLMPHGGDSPRCETGPRWVTLGTRFVNAFESNGLADQLVCSGRLARLPYVHNSLAALRRIANVMGVDARRAVRRDLQVLRERGLVEVCGFGRGAVWARRRPRERTE